MPSDTRSSRSVVIDTTTRFMVPVAGVLSIFLLVSGHDRPGGGFVGGLVAGAAVVLRWAAGGLTEVRAGRLARPSVVLGTGMVIASCTAALPLIAGDPVLTAWTTDVDVPVFGHVHLSMSLAFDVGVYLVVLGLTLMLLEAFGDEPEDLDLVLDEPTVGATDDAGGDA